MKKSFLIKVLGLTMALSLIMVSAAFASGFGSDAPAVVPAGGLVGGLATTDGQFDNGIVNANKTGVGVGGQTAKAVIKAKPTQRTHGEYQNNTNSCASCHQTHTAAAENLLFKDGVYTTCTACHDGTLGVLNVFTGSSAGTFAGTAGGNGSMHLPTGVLTTSAAPGGNKLQVGSDATKATWTDDFTCASCHSPHGSYSDRLLNYNPNNIGATPYYFQTVTGAYTDATGTVTSGNAGDLSATTAQAIKSGGLQATGPFVTSVPAVADAVLSPDFLIYKTTSDSATLGANTIPVGPLALNSNTAPAGSAVIVVMKKVGTTYVRDMTPWINDSATISRGAFTWFANNINNDIVNNKIKAGITLDLGYGFAVNTVKETAIGDATDILNTAKFCNIGRATVVKFTLKSYPTLVTFMGREVKQVDQGSYDATGYGVPVANFCASCHTDYLAKSGSPSGVWSQAFRHSTTSDSYTCLKCHFAHGTDVTVMQDAKDQNVATLTGMDTSNIGLAAGSTITGAQATAYMLDTNASSALKRYTGMSVCWKCHTSSHSGDFVNNTYVSGANASIKTGTEFSTKGTNLPNGWVPSVNGPSTQPVTPTIQP